MARREPRRRTPKTDRPIAVGIAWYDATQWSKLKQVAADPERLEDTQEEWQRNAEETERGLAARGVVVRRIPIDLDALVAWCRARNKPVDGPARAEYTSFMLRDEMLP
jgi:hypothetical protein